MKNFTPTDKLETLRVGDTLTLADGTVHKAVETKNPYNAIYCDDGFCSIYKQSICSKIGCTGGHYHFKLIKP